MEDSKIKVKNTQVMLKQFEIVKEVVPRLLKVDKSPGLDGILDGISKLGRRACFNAA